METMKLWDGRSVPRVGMGCWAIGGQPEGHDGAAGYGHVDTAESRAALRLARDLGALLFDTADAYGRGHSETLIGEAFGDDEEVVIVTKFGYWLDPTGGLGLSPAGVRKLVDDSRRRLKRDRLDLVFFHPNEFPAAEAGPVFDTLGTLRAEGKIAAFGWSTDYLDSLAAYVDREGFVAVENDLNVFTPANDLMALAERKGLVSINRLPLAMGLLTGKYSDGRAVGALDIRASDAPWLKFFAEGRANPAYGERLAAIRELLTTDGRTLAQGALGWILARSPIALPVPGFKTEAQVRENFAAAEKGPLAAEAMAEIDRLLEMPA